MLSEQAVQVQDMLLRAAEERRADDETTLQLSLNELIYEMQRTHEALTDS